MKIENIDIQATIEKAQATVREDKQMSASTKTMFEVLILIITLLVNRLGLNSNNSSKPPSTDPNRKRKEQKKKGKKPGGQKGHVGTTLQKVDNPDRVEEIEIDRRTLPPGKYSGEFHLASILLLKAVTEILVKLTLRLWEWKF